MGKNREIYVLQWGTPAKLDYQVEEKDRETVDSWGSLYNRAKTFLKSPQIVLYKYQKFLEYLKFTISYSLPSKVILRPLFQNQKNYQKYFSKLKLNLRSQKAFGRIVRQLRLAIR